MVEKGGIDRRHVEFACGPRAQLSFFILSNDIFEVLEVRTVFV
jgi:hypothetical protein